MNGSWVPLSHSYSRLVLREKVEGLYFIDTAREKVESLVVIGSVLNIIYSGKIKYLYNILSLVQQRLAIHRSMSETFMVIK